ncbi:MAG: hypothetical protein ACLURV_11280 [Gallintestinimicrobium sp.]
MELTRQLGGRERCCDGTDLQQAQLLEQSMMEAFWGRGTAIFMRKKSRGTVGAIG